MGAGYEVMGTGQEIPAYAGMTWVVCGNPSPSRPTRVCRKLHPDEGNATRRQSDLPFSFDRNCLRNFETLGRTTTRQYGWKGFFLKYCWW